MHSESELFMWLSDDIVFAWLHCHHPPTLQPTSVHRTQNMKYVNQTKSGDQFLLLLLLLNDLCIVCELGRVKRWRERETDDKTARRIADKRKSGCIFYLTYTKCRLTVICYYSAYSVCSHRWIVAEDLANKATNWEAVHHDIDAWILSRPIAGVAKFYFLLNFKSNMNRPQYTRT